MYNFEEFSINFRVRYFRGGPITLVNSNNLSKEENDIVYYNLDEPVGSDVLTFQLGFLWKVVE